jgi:hypothetical protein
MRQYLAMQAMESGKGLGGNFIGRGGLTPYGGGGMLLGGDQGPQGKVGMLWHSHSKNLILTSDSHSSFVLPILKYWFMEANWPEYDGSNYLLFTR